MKEPLPHIEISKRRLNNKCQFMKNKFHVDALYLYDSCRANSSLLVFSQSPLRLRLYSLQSKRMKTENLKFKSFRDRYIAVRKSNTHTLYIHTFGYLINIYRILCLSCFVINFVFLRCWFALCFCKEEI